MRKSIGLAAALCGALLSGVALCSTDPVLEWNAIMVSTTAGQNPFLQARSAAITQLAVFEAVNTIDGDFDPYLGTLTASPGASPEAAAITAAHDVLLNFFPGSQAALDQAQEVSLGRIPDSPAKHNGIAVGAASAAAFIQLRSSDGSTPARFYVPLSLSPGEWQKTPSCPPAGGILLQWPDLRPFAIESADQFRSAPQPVLGSPRYAHDYDEVLRVGGVDSQFRPQDRADVARFFAATPPVSVWNSVAAQLAVEQGGSMSDRARTLALINIGISDAAAAVFDTKYSDHFWRPETAIHASGNTSWMPYVKAPCFPTYGSAHASLSGAAREVLERIYGRGQ
ncbi:MAG: vanadium-dependent haloperoxidase, partial [Sinobacteraceae bacterium]|nr:vanadium-dependent haloperoxidase [Nevskiaceae bacterium]